MIKHFLFFCTLLFSIPSQADYNVIGIGTPAIDYIQQVSEPFLQRLALSKGGWKESDAHAFAHLLLKAAESAPPLIFSGGSACNTMKGLAALGMNASITGNLGNDAMGDQLLMILQEANVTPLCTRGTTPTSQIACLITPDGERSFCAYIRAEKEISPHDLRKKYFEDAHLVHVEGYRLINETYIETAMKMGKERGALISFDLCNLIYGDKYRERVLGFLNEYVDIVFLDKDEAYALTHLDPENTCHFLRNYCSIVVVKVGDRGCFVGSDETVTHYPGLPSNLVDATGAGDLFNSGFLYGILNNAPIEKCAYFGNLLGSTVIKQFGAEIPEEKWPLLLEKMR
ncbi:MAG: Ribokinase [Chlamydiales bacterium]|nr:Ribokinase [Chlamydiales bacterium]MCH9619312.1 Ribokinase [Chlamydiales bacterium]MCH9622574.1 Ribokinase [Chlamydiales bacterium]